MPEKGMQPIQRQDQGKDHESLFLLKHPPMRILWPEPDEKDKRGQERRTEDLRMAVHIVHKEREIDVPT